jgi:hypothetical protein
MWTHNGDISGGFIQQVDSGPMVVKGNIDNNSFVVLVSTGGPITIDGKIDGSSVVVLTSMKASITITGKVDGSSSARLDAFAGIKIGTKGGGEDKKIDGSSHVQAVAGANISLGSRIDGSSTVDFSAHGGVMVGGRIDGSCIVRHLADGDVRLQGKIDGSSRVEFVSNRGSVFVEGKIDGSSAVSLTAGDDVSIGHGLGLGDEDRKIDGNSFVVAIAGGDIDLGGRIAKDFTSVDMAASGSIKIDKEIGYGATVRLLSDSGTITVAGGINGSSTHVTFWPMGALTPTSTVVASQWAASGPLALSPARAGYWWENWGQTFGYVAPFRVVPRSLDDIVAAIVGKLKADGPDLTPVKAVGGGWSFTDAALPFKTQSEVDMASIQVRGSWQRQAVWNILKGVTDDTFVRPMDLMSEAVARNRAFSTSYDQANFRQATTSGEQLPASGEVRIIDTRSLASSLQCDFDKIRATDQTPGPGSETLFHVEAGITMADLQQLLDHQYPRLAVKASGGSPGATLAGALSTATHGGEYNTPLLIDCVRAVHLVGPGGEQWWIEGDVPVADPVKLQAQPRYSTIDAAHFIGGTWKGITGLTAQDVLKAVAVSMGTMGVIYSMVIAVGPQFGLRQIVHPTRWSRLVEAANTTEAALHAGDATANLALLDVLMDGTRNGTGISKSNNRYVDLAINPINKDCWVVNREQTKTLPDDPNSPAPSIGDFMNALSMALSGHAVDSVQNSRFAGRIFDFLSWATDVPGINLDDDIHDAEAAGKLIDFVMSFPDVFGAVLATGSAQAVMNVINSTQKDRGHQFLGDMLTGFFHALEGTAPGRNSDLTGVSYKVGAVGWPDGGLPGRGLEIALDPAHAFTFLQKVLLDDVLKTMAAKNKPLLGYISIRVCPTTQTLMGMQQYARHSVMIEVVSYRSPEANAVMDEIQAKALAWPGSPKPLLHWGLENDQVTGAYLATTPLGKPYKGGFTRLEAFTQIRDYIRNGKPPVFDNNFTNRLGL